MARGTKGLVLALVVVLALTNAALAQTDEIQVYDGGLAPKGVFNLTVHSNFTPSGIKEPAFPGAVTAIECRRWSRPQVAGKTEDGCSSVAPAPTRGGLVQVHRPGPGGGLHDRSARFSRLRH